MMSDSAAEKGATQLRKPSWLRVRIGSGPGVARLRRLVHKRRLHTVCEEALCPNLGECWEAGHAALMILGEKCTRSCKFCGVGEGPAGERDDDEPRRVAEAVRGIGLKHVVLTSVTRDDLADGGAAIWAATIRAVHASLPEATVEALVPDFAGCEAALRTVLESGPEILAHNLETVARLYPSVRPQGNYEGSLRLLELANRGGLVTKSGIMVGLGETDGEVSEAMTHARDAGCSIFTIGQYLQPSKRHTAVERYLEPAVFDKYRRQGLELGFAVVVAAPLVRSSYRSAEQDDFMQRIVGGASRETV
jgi:lipoic acid synthetase